MQQDPRPHQPDRATFTDAVLTRLRAADPAASAPPLNQEKINAMIADIIKQPKSAYARLRLAYAGALSASIAATVAVIAVVSQSAALPVLALGSHGVGATSAMMIWGDFSFSSQDPVNVTGSTSLPIYTISAPGDLATVTSQLASDFSMTGTTTTTNDSFGTTTNVVTSDAGAQLSVYVANGVPTFSYQQSPITTPTTSTSAATDTSSPSAPSADQVATVTSEAATLAAAISTADQAAPSVDTSVAGQIDVTVPLTAGGAATDQSLFFSYDDAGTLLDASGIDATFTAGDAYPLISATAALSDVEARYPSTSTTTTTTAPATDQTTTTQDAGSGADTGSASSETTTTIPATATTPTSAPAGTTDTTTPGSTTNVVPAPPTYDVAISSAYLELATYVLSDNTTVLLPVWVLSGQETGDSFSGTQEFSATTLAVDPTYVHLSTSIVEPMLATR
jgi:hypothetical protein